MRGGEREKEGRRLCVGPKEEASHGACSQAEGGGGLPRPIRGSEQQPFATMSMFDEMKHAVHNVFKASVESVTSVSHVSQFRQVIPHTCRHAHVSAALRARCGRAAHDWLIASPQHARRQRYRAWVSSHIRVRCAGTVRAGDCGFRLI